MMRIIQTNITTTILKKFFIIKKMPISNVFLGLIYTIVPKLLVIILITIWILNSDVTKYIFDH